MSELELEPEHGHDPFTIRVAMTMAIIACCLAAVAMIGHSAHNMTLQKLGEVNRLRTEEAGAKVESSNEFAHYQSKRDRLELLQLSKQYLTLLAPAPNTEKQREDAIGAWALQTNVYATELTALLNKGEQLKWQAGEKAKEAEEAMRVAESTHKQADWYDIAHLLTEIGLVLCSIAVLTKLKGFWLTGIGVSVVSIIIVCYAMFAIG